MKKNIAIIIAILVSLIGLFFLSSNVIINIQWFKEIGYLNVYFTKIIAILKLMIPIFLICFLIIYFYGKSIVKKVLGVIGDEKKKQIYKINIIVSLITSLVLAYGTASTYWYRILQFTNSVEFNYKDPLFNNDISFYVFKLPLLQSLYSLLIILLIALIVITFLSFILINVKDKIFSTNFNYNSARDVFKYFAGKQLAVLVSAFMIVISIGYILKSYSLLYSPRGVVYGAGYADVKITLLFYRVIFIVSIIAAIVVFISIKKLKIKPIIFSAVSILALIVIEPIVANVFHSFIVKSNEMELEKPYISNHIEATRMAFNINGIEEREFAPKYDLNNEQLSQNKDIIENLKVNSMLPVLTFYNQVQVIKNFYEFYDGDTDRYNINGDYTQVFLAPREIDYNGITTWQNKHLRYTHGYGVTMSKVNSVTSEGQPDFLMKDIPTNNITDIPLDNPRIYFGEGNLDYAIVNTDVEEFDYPSGGENKTNKYEGESGIPMNFLNRILFSINEKSIRILFSSDINNDSKILLNRNIVERAKKIAPFLDYDSDPYIVIDEGKLFWIIDAYTTTDKFPYSKPYDKKFNYIRNSVKVVIDAYNGDTNFYLVDKNDPIAVSYSKIFKGLFNDVESAPNGIRNHFKYPQNLFDIQCNVLGKYHMTNPTVFFTEEDVWEVSSNINEIEGKENTNEALYMMTRLPGEKNLEMLLFEYFNIKGKQNMVSLLSARMDGDNYGELILYRFPPDKTVYSPVLFKNKIRTDSDISKEISLWQGKGAKVDYGDTVILPINESLLYLETIYLKADSENSLPEVKKIIVSDGEQIVGANTVEEALGLLFGYKDGKNNNLNNNQENNISNSNVKKAKQLYDNAINAQKSGNWADYGKYIEELGKFLESLDSE
ncbi:UPF0182 family protein [Clostridium fallax]|uniref:UPF0182 protein SAMN05443638_1105 n=1 Tax=Clostridium fallax TaxID=1533 RepID=A0A1M4W1U3_9CLOT|nr:UPF0182 family protein [Clostridium fallax]SHE75093.1 hypothetical protein SAMN05443638_1105 [Clostridium fallax]SQB22832.1 membrane protein [Clostridium fallax]